MEWLAENTERRLARDGKARCSGLLIDTPGVTGSDSKNRWEWIRNAVKAFKGEWSRKRFSVSLFRLFELLLRVLIITIPVFFHLSLSFSISTSQHHRSPLP